MSEDAQALQVLIDRILERTQRELGFPVGGYRMMLNGLLKARPNDVRAFLRIIRDESGELK